MGAAERIDSVTDYAAEFDQIGASKPGNYAADFEALSTETPKAEVAKSSTTPTRSAFAAANPIGEVGANVLTGLGASIIGGYHGLWKLATGQGLDAAASAVREDQAKMTYQPEPGTTGAKAVAGFQSGYNPLNWPALASHWAGEKTFEMTGSPGLGVGVELLGNLAPLGLLAKEAKQAAPAIDTRARIEPKPYDIEVRGTATPQPVAQPAASVSSLVERPPQTQRGPVFAEADPAETLPAGKALDNAQMTTRSDVLERVGIPKERQRNSAVQGDLQGAADDYRSKLVSNAQGEFWRDQFDRERGALTSHAESIAQGTGGTVALDESARYGQGTRIVEPLDAIRKDFDARTKKLYDEAATRAGDMPNVSLGGLQEYLAKNSEFATPEKMALRRGIRSYLKEQEIIGADGKVNPITVQQAEQLRQYINGQYSYQTSGLAGKLKGKLDEDVFSVAGEDVYQAARALHQLRSKTLDNPKGISALMDSEPGSPMNRAIPLEKIPDRITQMPVDQIQHIVNVLKNVPEELKPQAQQAISEIQASFANKALDLGSKRAAGEPWGANDVSKFLRDNREKVAVVFKDRPDLMAKLQDLNDAGHILAPKTAYRGAPAEAHNLLQRGAVHLITPAATSAGAFLGGPVGAGLGGFVGHGLAGKVGEKIALKNAQKRVGTSRLADINPK